jgi:hypothetical protein
MTWRQRLKFLPLPLNGAPTHPPTHPPTTDFDVDVVLVAEAGLTPTEETELRKAATGGLGRRLITAVSHRGGCSPPQPALRAPLSPPGLRLGHLCLEPKDVEVVSKEGLRTYWIHRWAGGRAGGGTACMWLVGVGVAGAPCCVSSCWCPAEDLRLTCCALPSSCLHQRHRQALQACSPMCAPQPPTPGGGAGTFA